MAYFKNNLPYYIKHLPCSFAKVFHLQMVIEIESVQNGTKGWSKRILDHTHPPTPNYVRTRSLYHLRKIFIIHVCMCTVID